VFVAIGVAATLQIILFVVRSQVQAHAELWPAMYLPILLGTLYVSALTWQLGRPRHPVRDLPT
jgi:hypothetical protein